MGGDERQYANVCLGSSKWKITIQTFLPSCHLFNLLSVKSLSIFFSPLVAC